MLPRAFRRSAPLAFCEGAFPLVSEGMEIPGAPRALRKQGRRSFGFLFAGCLKCESEIRARKVRRLLEGVASHEGVAPQRTSRSRSPSPRHARPCAGHPRLAWLRRKAWMAGTSPAMTNARVRLRDTTNVRLPPHDRMVETTVAETTAEGETLMQGKLGR